MSQVSKPKGTSAKYPNNTKEFQRKIQRKQPRESEAMYEDTTTLEVQNIHLN